MLAVVYIALLSGMLLGRFRVLILAPGLAIVAVFGLVFTAGIYLHGTDASRAALTTIFALIALQVGYCIGTALLFAPLRIAPIVGDSRP